ncbi:terminase [Pseudomonas gingeri]|uniref:Terminase n=1 Tax=Pseudomonas gingeri TaxID=117681 RepID=A0A7Y8C6H9_9PSED|nr:terminase [Pseudomonas gingeri]NWA27588.1 terminase [Pseudomonas gingeri]NWC00412.1 terminase [Pseudomonas gingeri]NWD69657.1 terminase [Pseudomonas gingeri]NWD75535.1 terminase [Pseudomonas gingeri]
MGQRHPNFPAWQWRVAPQATNDGTGEGMQLLALILFALSFLLVSSGVFAHNPTDFAVGVLGLAAAFSLRSKGQRLVLEA